MNDNKVFVDTNILIYAYDVSAGAKHTNAARILSDLWATGRGVVSTQVLQEFFVSVTRKIPKPINDHLAASLVRDLLRWELVVNDGEFILEAASLISRYLFSFWDCLIIQAALKSSCDILLSEDLSDGQVIESTRIRNPFLEESH
jgi:predicted nucleic acid-binding protein